MNFFDKKLHEAAVAAAAKLPPLAEGGSILDPVWRLQPRKDGCWRVFKNASYWGTTGCKEEADARRWLDIFLLQQEAEDDGLLDVRRVSATVVIEHRKKAVVKKKLKGAKVIVSTLKAIEGHVKDLQLRHLTDDRIEEIGEAMAAAGYAYETYVNAVRFLRTAIRQYTKKSFGAVFLPFDAPPSPKGRTTVVTDPQRDLVKRWSLGEEAYDPKTKRFTPQHGLSDRERRDRQVAYRELFLGMTFGSRPGAYANLSWEQNDEGGWLDLDGAVFHRVPPGRETPSNKLAPPVDIPEEVALAELRRWKESDAGNPWVFRTLKGGPLSQRQQQVIFKAAMAALGLVRVTGHVLRHTCITNMIHRRCTGPEISSVCGISIAMLYRRYGHFDNRVVQKLAHGAMAKAMGEARPAS